MASKRSAELCTNGPPLKKSFLLSEPINLGPVSTEVSFIKFNLILEESFFPNKGLQLKNETNFEAP